MSVSLGTQQKCRTRQNVRGAFSDQSLTKNLLYKHTRASLLPSQLKDPPDLGVDENVSLIPPSQGLTSFLFWEQGSIFYGTRYGQRWYPNLTSYHILYLLGYENEKHE